MIKSSNRQACLPVATLFLLTLFFFPSATAATIEAHNTICKSYSLSGLSAKDKLIYESYLKQYEQAMKEGNAKLWRLRIESFLAESHSFARKHTCLTEFWETRAKAAQLIYDSVFGTEAATVLNMKHSLQSNDSQIDTLLNQLKDVGWLKPISLDKLEDQVTPHVAAYSQLTKVEEKLIMKAEQGTPKNRADLGGLYLTGRVVTHNDQKAFYWLQKAAEQGESSAQHNLGYMYMKGKYVHKDLKKAVFWFQKAAEQGNPYAQNKLGYLYTHGRELQKDRNKAIELFLKGAEQGNAIAQYNLADMYYYGRGVPKDYAKAFHWYKLSAEQGDALAQLNLGYFYEHGYGTGKDYDAAIYWYQQSADQANTMAQSNLHGILKWYKK